MTERQQRICVWVGFAFAPLFFLDGPLAWSGLVAWWLLAVAFFVWMVTMTWLMLRASRQPVTDVADDWRPSTALRNAASG